LTELTGFDEPLPDVESPGITPVIRNVQLMSAERSVTVQWETDVPTAGQIWLRTTPQKADYRLSAEQGWGLPMAGVGVSEPYSTQHRLVVPWLDMNRVYFATLAAVDSRQRVALLSELRVETVKGSILNSAVFMLRTWYRSLPCWLRDNGLLSAAVSGAALAAIVGAITWRAKRWRTVRNAVRNGHPKA
jgi:hypothetical protein